MQKRNAIDIACTVQLAKLKETSTIDANYLALDIPDIFLDTATHECFYALW